MALKEDYMDWINLSGGIPNIQGLSLKAISAIGADIKYENKKWIGPMRFNKKEFYDLLEKADNMKAFELIDYLLDKKPVEQNVYVGRSQANSGANREPDVVVATIHEGYTAPRKDWLNGLYDPWYYQLSRDYEEWLED